MPGADVNIHFKFMFVGTHAFELNHARHNAESLWAKSPSFISCHAKFHNLCSCLPFRRSTFESQGQKNVVYNTQNFEI